MLIKTNANGFNHAISSEITSPVTYQGRRDLMKLMATGAAGAALATWASREAMAQTVEKPGKLAALAGGKSAVAGAVTMEKNHRIQRRDHLQQLLRVWHRQVRPGQERPHTGDQALVGGY